MIKDCSIVWLLLLAGLAFFLLWTYLKPQSVEGFCPDWWSKTALIQEGDCCDTNDDCMIKYECVKGTNKCGSYGTCQRPKGNIDQCRSIGWTSSYNNICID